MVMPDGGEVHRLSAALREAIGEASFVELTADLGPTERYRRFLKLARGQVRAVVGTRAAAYAPVADLGLVPGLEVTFSVKATEVSVYGTFKPVDPSSGAATVAP